MIEVRLLVEKDSKIIIGFNKHVRCPTRRKRKSWEWREVQKVQFKGATSTFLKYCLSPFILFGQTLLNQHSRAAAEGRREARHNLLSS